MNPTIGVAIEVGSAVGEAIARDVLAESMPGAWTGLDPQDADQLGRVGIAPNTHLWDVAERAAQAAYLAVIAAAGATCPRCGAGPRAVPDGEYRCDADRAGVASWWAVYRGGRCAAYGQVGQDAAYLASGEEVGPELALELSADLIQRTTWGGHHPIHWRAWLVAGPEVSHGP